MTKTMKVKYRMRAPLSHIGEVASNGSYFQTVLTSFGRIPIVTGNSVRGILRDAGAKHLLELTDAKVPQEVFHVFFSGGNISGTMRNDLERAKLVREHFPLISILGAGIGTMLLSGKLISGNLYPVCDETAEMLQVPYPGISWHELIDEIEFTRMDDGKNDKNLRFFEPEETAEKAEKVASTQMRFSVQYMAVGTEFWQSLTLISPTDIELGCLYDAFLSWFQTPVLSGMSAKGFGLFDADVDDGAITVVDGKISASEQIQKLRDDYLAFVAQDDPTQWMYLLGGKK